MARMLQALKNLEARSAWPAARAGVLSHLSDQSPPPAPVEPPAPPPPQPLLSPPPAALFDSPPPLLAPEPLQFAAPSAIVVQQSERYDQSASEAVVVNSFPERTETHPEPAPPTTRPPTGAERAVRRTLGEPHRRQPLADLAARLRQDAHKTGSRTLLLVGIGPESATHETALHVASVLADEGGRVLLVDGDLARRQLSADLDDLQEPGLSNLPGDRSPERLLQPTAVENLTFLPVGTKRFADLEAAAGDLARAFGSLAADFDLVLVDGGRTGDPSLAALARLCDATYIVIQLGAVEATQAQQALRDLRAGGARVLGCIATGSEPS